MNTYQGPRKTTGRNYPNAVSTYLSDRTLEQLEAEAQSQNMSYAKLIRTILVERYERTTGHGYDT